MWSSGVLLFPATAVRTILYLLPGIRLVKVLSIFEDLPGTETSCIFVLLWSNNTRLYKSTFPDERSHWTCKLVNVVFSLLISKWDGGKGSVVKKKKKRTENKPIFLASGLKALHRVTKTSKTLPFHHHTVIVFQKVFSISKHHISEICLHETPAEFSNVTCAYVYIHTHAPTEKHLQLWM